MSVLTNDPSPVDVSLPRKESVTCMPATKLLHRRFQPDTDRSIVNRRISGLFTGSNVRGGWPQLAEHNLLAAGHRVRYRRDRHGHLPPRVSVPKDFLLLSTGSVISAGSFSGSRGKGADERMQLRSTGMPYPV